MCTPASRCLPESLKERVKGTVIERKPKVGSQKDDEVGFVFPEINQQHTQERVRV